MMRSLTPDDFRNSGQRGMGFALMYQGDRSADDLDAFAATGANTARLGLEFIRKGSAFVIPSEQLQRLDRTIDQLAKRGVRSIVCVSAGVQGECRGRYIWTNKTLRASFVAQHRTLAKRYKGRGEVAGIDLFNEPTADGSDEPPYADRQAAWQALATLTVAGIRKIDPTRICIVESAPDATPQSFATLQPLADPLVVYSLHSYMPMAYTHQRGVMADFPNAEVFDGSVMAVLYESLTTVLDWLTMHKRPVYVGEFSAVQSAPGAADYVRESIALFEAMGVSWSFHAFRGWQGWDPEVAGEEYIRTADAPIITVLREAFQRPRGNS